MHRDVHSADEMHRQVDDDPLVAVLADLHDAIARLDREPF